MTIEEKIQKAEFNSTSKDHYIYPTTGICISHGLDGRRYNFILYFRDSIRFGEHIQIYDN